MNQLAVENLTKTYRVEEGRILDSISLEIAAGELFFLLGPSGCGKSTLLRSLAGFVEPDSGRILLNGRDITGLPPEKRNMPMVFQNYALWPHLTVAENVAFALGNRKLGAKEKAQRVDSLLETVRMREFAGRRIGSLSGGQQQRVALARALAPEPAVLLLDEPLSNLDAKLRDIMRFEIRRICKERSLTAVYVTHDRKEALSMADRMAVLNNGRISRLGAPREVYLHPGNSFTAAFLGDVNFIDGECLASDGACAHFATAAGTLEVRDPAAAPVRNGEKRLLAFRPESIRCDAPENAVNRLSVTLEKSAFLGESTFHTVRLADGRAEWNINEFAGPDRAPGSVLSCAVPPERISVLED